MCGIAGFARLQPTDGSVRLGRALRAMDHRGPDQSDLYDSPHASLGAVRLKIIDLHGGDQPIVFSDPRTVLVFNGEIYNHRELRRELEAAGHRFRSSCDTETFLHAFLEWDVEAFSRLHGMFAAAIWSEAARRMVLVRDRLGIKPLYFRSQASSLYFGSELKCLFAHPELNRQIDFSALQHYLSLNYVPGPSTLVEGIEKLPPGTWLEWRDGAIRTESYWRLQMRPDAAMNMDDAAEELDRLLRKSVRDHLISDVPLGAWISGGLDSSAILHYAAEASPRPLKTFSVSFQGRSFDESRFSRVMARAYGADHEEIDVNPSLDLAAAIERLAYFSDEPNADAGAVPLWFLSERTRASVTAVLSGEGADELFAGYETYRANQYRRRLSGLPRPLVSLGCRIAGWLPVSNEKIGLDYKLTRFLQGLKRGPLEAHLFWNGTFSEEEKRVLYTRYQAGDTAALLEAGLLDGHPPDSLEHALAADQSFYLPDNILCKCDRVSMAHSIELRPPFLDHRIVEFANRLPARLKLRGGESKAVLRRLMKGKLPPGALNRRKEGLDIPVHDWLRTPLRPLLLDTLNERDVKASGLFHWPAVERLLAAHLDGRRNAGYHLWGLLVLFLWIKTWKISCHPPAERARRIAAVSGSAR